VTTRYKRAPTLKQTTRTASRREENALRCATGSKRNLLQLNCIGSIAFYLQWVTTTLNCVEPVLVIALGYKIRI
jgi:hypothetical protein